MKKEQEGLATLKVKSVRITVICQIRGGQTSTTNIVIEDIIEI